MPYSITIDTIRTLGENLAKEDKQTVTPGVTVSYDGKKIQMYESGRLVFVFKLVTVAQTDLEVDKPENQTTAQDGRGWGHLGMLIALYYGKACKATKVKLGSSVENHTNRPRADKFWARFGIGNSSGTMLRYATTLGEQWVRAKCPQPVNGPLTMQILDAQLNANANPNVNTTTRTRSSSLSGVK